MSQPTQILNRFATASCIVALVSTFSFTFTLNDSLLAQDQAGPTKKALIEDLKAMFPLLIKKDYVAAAEFVSAPEGFKPAMLNRLVDLQEISLEGILRLERDGKFGKAADVFGEERAKALVERHKVDVNQCYGFNHEFEGATGEVIAFWNGSRFKLTRIDDVGKLAGLDGAPVNPSDPPMIEPVKPKTEAQPKESQPKTLEESAAEQQAIKEKMIAMIPGLTAAIQSDPNNVSARLKYAMILLKIENPPGAWEQVRAAAKIDPQFPGLGQRINMAVVGFERMGAFTVGVPEETIGGLLGKPDQTVDLGGGRTRWVYNFLGVDFTDKRLHSTIDLREATEKLFMPTEVISIDLDGRGWRCGSRNKRKDRVVARYFIPGEMMTNWKEQVRIERLVGASKIGDIDLLVELMGNDIQSREGVKFKVLESDKTSAIIAIDYPKTVFSEKRFELVKLMVGPEDLHRVYYVKKTDELTRETQVQWLAIMQAAKLDKVKPAESK